MPFSASTGVLITQTEARAPVGAVSDRDQSPSAPIAVRDRSYRNPPVHPEPVEGPSPPHPHSHQLLHGPGTAIERIRIGQPVHGGKAVAGFVVCGHGHHLQALRFKQSLRLRHLGSVPPAGKRLPAAPSAPSALSSSDSIRGSMAPMVKPKDDIHRSAVHALPPAFRLWARCSRCGYTSMSNLIATNNL